MQIIQQVEAHIWNSSNVKISNDVYEVPNVINIDIDMDQRNGKLWPNSPEKH